jgi:ATP-dependent Lon protease
MSSSKEFELPVLPLREPGLIVFPGLFCEVNIARDFSLNALKCAKANGDRVIVARQSNPTEIPRAKDLYGMCTEAKVKRILSLDKVNIKVKVILVGIKRCILKTVGMTCDSSKGGYLRGTLEEVTEPKFVFDSTAKDIFVRIKELLAENFRFVAIGEDIIPRDNSDPLFQEKMSLFLDNVAGQISLSPDKKSAIFRSINILDRSRLILSELSSLAKQVGVEVNKSDIDDEDSSDSNDEDVTNLIVNEVDKLTIKVRDSSMPPEILSIAEYELKRLSMMSPSSSEFQVSFNYVSNLSSMPWNRSTNDILDIDRAEKILNKDHYGLKKPKERIIEFLSVRKLRSDGKGPILCLVGPPGVGKTSLGKSIAKSMGRKFIRVSLGGIGDEAEIRGHRRTYVGSIPGKVMENIKRIGSNNPVFMMDEVDKMSTSFRGDPSSALLEVLDPEQNNAFVDHYLGVPFDLSNVFFICTCNEVASILPALKDRMEIIEICGYSLFDKVKIAKNYLIPKQREVNGIGGDISFSTKAISKIVEEYTNEAGVRALEQECGSIMRKIAVKINRKMQSPSVIKVNMIPEYLGPPKSFADVAADRPEIGLSTGLACSRNGGSILFVEVVLTSGSGKVKLTGNLGKVIQESANAAYTWIYSNVEKLHINEDTIKNNDIHVHFPGGGIPKDGPSAGAAIAISMLSAITKIPVRNDVAITGEITLHGKILPVGGIREKILAAYKSGIKEILIPERNKYDVDEVPKSIREDISIILTSELHTVVDVLLLKKL